MVNMYQGLKCGSIVLILLQLFLIRATSAVDANCNYYQNITPSVTYYVYNTEYPNLYGPSRNCRWVAVAPEGYRINVTCQIDIPASKSCTADRLLISTTGNTALEKSNVYCGYGNTTLQSESNNITIGLLSASNTTGGRFLCTLKTIEILEPMCDCGWKQVTRIVGGIETKVNEYPMMAALIDYVIEQQFCGATIISQWHAISAAHCFRDLTYDKVGLLVGDYDLSTGTDTNATTLHNVEKIILHPAYDFNHIESSNDIAIIKTKKYIEFTMAVGPACLPFRYYQDSFANQIVEVLGWGTTEFTGPKSDVLLKTNLTVLSQQSCYSKVNGTTTQMCTFMKGHDACQSDSGGPLLWHNDDDNRLYLVGIVSTGFGCASNVPGLNTRVTSFMLWIMSNSIGTDYCVK